MMADNVVVMGRMIISTLILLFGVCVHGEGDNINVDVVWF